MADQQRARPRRRVLKGGKIVFHKGYSVIDCLVRDLSEAGARLKLGDVVGVPAEFILRVAGAPDRACRVIWRSAEEIGVEFVAGAEGSATEPGTGG
jgi:hypothetical protein